MVDREFVDEVESGSIPDRSQLRKMIDKATKSHAPFPEILAHKDPDHNSKTVLSTVHVGGPECTVLRTFRWEVSI